MSSEGGVRSEMDGWMNGLLEEGSKRVLLQYCMDGRFVR